MLRSGHTAQKNLNDNGKGERLNAKELVAVDGDRQLRETLVTSIHATIVLLVAYEAGSCSSSCSAPTTGHIWPGGCEALIAGYTHTDKSPKCDALLAVYCTLLWYASTS